MLHSITELRIDELQKVWTQESDNESNFVHFLNVKRGIYTLNEGLLYTKEPCTYQQETYANPFLCLHPTATRSNWSVTSGECDHLLQISKITRQIGQQRIPCSCISPVSERRGHFRRRDSEIKRSNLKIWSVRRPHAGGQVLRVLICMLVSVSGQQDNGSAWRESQQDNPRDGTKGR